MSNKQSNSSLDRRFSLLLATVVLLTVASGWTYGRLTQRWGAPADLVAAADHVLDFPKQIGPWQLAQDKTMPDDIQQMLECAGYINRQYIHEETGQSVALDIIVGPSGPTAVHTPEICYSSRSYTLKEAREKKSVATTDHSYWGIRLTSRHAGSQQLQVYYAWNNGEHWEASKNPRIQFGGNRLLYKATVAGLTGLGLGKEATDPAWEFVQALSKSEWHPKTTEFNTK